MHAHDTQAGGEGSERYEGDLKGPQLLAWLKQYSSVKDAEPEEAAAGGAAKGDKSDKGGKKSEKKKPEDLVKISEVTPEEAAKLDEGEDMHLLAVHTGGSPKACCMILWYIILLGRFGWFGRSATQSGQGPLFILLPCAIWP